MSAGTQKHEDPRRARNGLNLTPRRIALALAGVAAALAVFILVLAAIDFLTLDRTSGGTPPTYEDFSGTPIDWDSAEITDAGLVRRGRVLHAHLNCTTGMLSMEFFGLKRNYRTVSERALYVHQPREACLRYGFEPEF